MFSIRKKINDYIKVHMNLNLALYTVPFDVVEQSAWILLFDGFN